MSPDLPQELLIVLRKISMYRLNRTAAVFSLAILILSGIEAKTAYCAYPGITLDYPGGIGTEATGVEGNLVVGFSKSSIDYADRGFIYDTSTSTFTTLPTPPWYRDDAENTLHPYGISGNQIVGTYHRSTRHGFIYDITTSSYTTLDCPSAGSGISGGTAALGISGNNIVGNYIDSSGIRHGFLYDGSMYLTLDDPSAAQNIYMSGTSALGISGNSVVGLYDDLAGKQHGFLYNISSKQYSTLDMPLATRSTVAMGIDGNTVVGNYLDESYFWHIFLYDLPTAAYSNLDINVPGSDAESFGISGNNIVGTYSSSGLDGNFRHGFVATIPEPSSFAIMLSTILCGLFWWRKRRL
jgi:hypothetical protein